MELENRKCKYGESIQ